MNIGKEQLIWAIIFIIFAIVSALRSRLRRKSRTTTEKTNEIKEKVKEEPEMLGKYLEEILGIEMPRAKPQIKVKKEKPRTLEKEVEPEPKVEKGIGGFTSPLIERYEKEMKSIIPKKKEVCHAKFPWGALSKKDFPSAIIFSEIIGPPIAKRKTHRLF